MTASKLIASNQRVALGIIEFNRQKVKLIELVCMNKLKPIEQPYLLCVNIKIYRDEEGHRYTDFLWYKDLKKHLVYLKNFTLACPCEQTNPPENTISIDSDSEFSQVSIVELPSPHSFAEAMLWLPVTVSRLWQAIGNVDIVHTGVVGWPFPMGWIVTPIILLQRKFYIIIVESSTWRLTEGIPAKLVHKLKAYISEKLNSWCLNQTDLAFFTQQEYQESLLTTLNKQGYVIHASWIDEENIISEIEANNFWHNKVSSTFKKIKVLFAGRLTLDKGILVLLEALKILDEAEVSVDLDILGQGLLLNECEKACQNQYKTVRIELLGTVPYNVEFFHLLRNYHLIVVPNLSDEQPRIVYDAYSQAVPILASNTPGLRDCVHDRITGLLVEPNNPTALAEQLKWSWQNWEELEKMGMAGLELAERLTHQEMHRKRWAILLDKLPNK